MSKGTIFILSAPSGTGKTTILKRIIGTLPGVAFSVSHTTRKPREGEVTGVDYHFVDRPSFLAMQEAGQFLECADVHGNLYGTSRSAVLEQIENNIDVILDIDVQGARIIKESGKVEATYIFLAPPNLEELEHRLRTRGQDSDTTIATRLHNAGEELAAIDRYEYLIVNESVDQAVAMFEAIIIAERSRHRRNYDGQAIDERVMLFGTNR